MFSKIHQHYIFAVILSLFVIFAGCDSSSTDSGSDNNNDNDNQNQSASFESGSIASGETFSYTFEEEEEVDYYCTIHTPDMRGTITVTSDVEAVDSDTVSMEGDQFIPDNLDVAPNTQVVWVNNENHDHNIKTGTPSSGNDGGDY